MKKVIVLSRVSTSHQDLTQQTEEILREVHKDGYTDPNIIIIEDVESAIKQTDILFIRNNKLFDKRSVPKEATYPKKYYICKTKNYNEYKNRCWLCT